MLVQRSERFGRMANWQRRCASGLPGARLTAARAAVARRGRVTAEPGGFSGRLTAIFLNIQEMASSVISHEADASAVIDLHDE
jgi:hypothetical protein